MLDMLAAFVRVHTSVFVHRRGGLRGAQQHGYEHDHGQAFSCDLSSRDRVSTTRTTQVASAPVLRQLNLDAGLQVVLVRDWERQRC